MGTNKKVCLVRVSSVCSRRTMDYLDVVRYAKANGFTVLPKDQIAEAEFGCLVTCGSTDSSNANSLSELDYLRTYIPEEKIVVLGCLSATLDGFKESFKGKFVAPIDYQKDFDNAFIDIGVMDALRTPYNEFDHSTEDFFEHIPYFSSEHWFLLTSMGCRGVCKYCRIKSAIGNLNSFSPESIVKSLLRGIAKGYRLFWPSGDDLGAYGLDIGETFPALLGKLIAVGESLGVSIQIDCRTVIDPRYLIKYEEELLKTLTLKRGNIISLGVGLQSPISRLLQLSNRYHEVDRIESVIAKIKEESGGLFMPAHLIVGFPTETIEETKRSFDFIERSPIDLWVCNRYSHLRGTRFYGEYKKLPNVPEENYNVFKELVYDSPFYYHELSPNGPLYILKNPNPRFFTPMLERGSPVIK
ncbi:MAG TPA: radical SAM protein [Candidatus Moranbacteria bacterium]|nr:radical SAM protein [Candidatus Moranbacteria bacterium]